MLGLAISLLWMLIYAIILCGVIWLVIYGIETFIRPIPERLKQGIWFIVLVLIIIAILSALAGGGSFHAPSFR